MSFKEVNSLRKAGKLNQALSLAESDLQVEQSHWTYSALFWVLRDYCNRYIAQKQNQYALSVLQRMESVFGNIDDYDGVAESTLQSLRRQLTPLWAEVNKLSELSKNGQEESAYTQICELNRNNNLSPQLHEDFGWIIYRFLKKCYELCGSINARRALHTYLQLQIKRPSTLHSLILNVATMISEKYKDFKFLPFLELWDVATLSDDDFCSSFWNNKEIQPLVERIIERCFKLGYGLNEVKEAFTKNQNISEDLVLFVFSRYHFFNIFSYSKENNIQAFFSDIDDYTSTINGLLIKNEYHSRILSLYLWKLPEEKDIESVLVINKWGLDNFRSEDWLRERKEEKDYPSLVEKVIKRYFARLKRNSFNNAAPEFELLLEKACKQYDDDQLDRNLAILLLERGEKEKALYIYRSLLLNLNRFYVWKELAEATDDVELKISAYCKAIVSEPKDEFLGDIHLALAKLMIEGGAFSEAKRELQTYADTYQNNGWRPKDVFFSLSSKISSSIGLTESNIPFYKSHMSSAEDFVYSDIDWTTMFVADVYVQKEGERQIKKAKLVSSDGVAIVIKYKKLPISNNNCIGKCFDVKIHSQVNRKEVVLIKESGSRIEQLLSPVVCYVDYYNKEKKCYHLVSESEKELLLSYVPFRLQEGTFCRCIEVPEKKEKTDNDFVFYYWEISSPPKKVRPSKAIFYDTLNNNEALVRFPIKTAVVDSVNENKELFHCVFGRNSDIVIKYNQTTIRPQIGDYVIIRYVTKTSKEGKDFRKMLTIEKTDTCDKVLKKTITGPIRINYNSKGHMFGFVDDYYVPTYLLEGIKEEEPVCVDVVFNGEKWQAYNLVRYNFNQE